MSSIHYKFRSLVSYKTVNFETLHVSVEELKKSIFDAEGLNPETFDLIIENSHTKREYSGNDIIPRNSSLIVKRIPRQDAAKLPKIQDTSTSGIVSKGQVNVAEMGFIKAEDFSKLTEEQRLEHVKQVSYQKYQPANYQRKPKYSMMSDPPPPNYTCNRCNRTGHWVKNCPLATIRRTTGLPMDELVETTADDPGAMLHPSGKYMVQKMHLNARLNSKAKAPLPFVRDTDQKPVGSEDENEKPRPSLQERPPNELVCPVCNDLINEAVVMTCCGSSFCAECIQNLIVEEPGRRCPGESCNQTLSVDAMIRNLSLRKSVENFKKKQMQSQWPGLSSRATQPGSGGQSPAVNEKELQPQKVLPTKVLIPQPKTEPTVQIVQATTASLPILSQLPSIISSASKSPIMLPDLTKPPPSILSLVNNSLPSSIPIIQIQQPSQPVIPTTTLPLPIQLPTSISSLFPTPNEQPSITDTSKQQPVETEAFSSPFDQDFSTPPHVQTPSSHEPTPPLQQNANTTLPPGSMELSKAPSPKRIELSREAIQAFSAFNPTASVTDSLDLFANLNPDIAPPGFESILKVPVFGTKIDPVSGRLLDSTGKPQKSELTKRRSPISRRRQDSRSPIRKTRKRSPEPYRRPRPRSPIRHSYSKRRRDESDHRREIEKKKKRERSVSPIRKRSKKEHKTSDRKRSKSKDRSRSPSMHKKRRNKNKPKEDTPSDESTSNTPGASKKEEIVDSVDEAIDEDENVIDSLIKETTLIVAKDINASPVKPPTITIAPISSRLFGNNKPALKQDAKVEKMETSPKAEKVKEEKMEVDKKFDKEPTPESKQTSPRTKSSATASQTTSQSNSQESSPEKPAFRDEMARTISLEIGMEEEMEAGKSESKSDSGDEAEPRNDDKSRDHSVDPKEKLSRKKSGEKKSKHKHKKRKDKKHKKDYKSEDSKSKKKKSKKSSKEKKHKKESSTPPRRHK